MNVFDKIFKACKTIFVICMNKFISSGEFLGYPLIKTTRNNYKNKLVS